MTNRGPTTRTARWIGAVLGVALMGALDEIIFHQLLQWHHFYIHATPDWRIVSDGVFHALTTLLWFVGAAQLWIHRHALATITSGRPFWSAILLGMGSFQVFDGIVNHKLLDLHPVREGVENIIPYDVGWILAGILLLLAGWFVQRHQR